MPQVQNQFAGHMYPMDPRGLMFGAQGSMWPTIPAYRYRARSQNATGSMVFLNGDGVLLTLAVPLPAMELVVWYYESTETPFPAVVLIKWQPPAAHPGFQWNVGVTPEVDTGFEVKEIVRPISRTNIDIKVGSIIRVFPDPGDTGSTFNILQVVWDETMPPE